MRKNNKKRLFAVTEDRGCSVNYMVFIGTLLECAMYVYDIAPVRASDYYNRTEKNKFFLFDTFLNPFDPDLRNGNGRPFEYSIWPA